MGSFPCVRITWWARPIERLAHLTPKRSQCILPSVISPSRTNTIPTACSWLVSRRLDGGCAQRFDQLCHGWVFLLHCVRMPQQQVERRLLVLLLDLYLAGVVFNFRSGSISKPGKSVLMLSLNLISNDHPNSHYSQHLFRVKEAFLAI